MASFQQRHFQFGLSRARRDHEYALAEEDAKPADLQTAAGFIPGMMIYGFQTEDASSKYVGHGRLNGKRVCVYLHSDQDGSKKFVVASHQSLYNNGIYIGYGHIHSDEQGKFVRFKFFEIAAHIEVRLTKNSNKVWARRIGLDDSSGQQVAA